MTPLTPDAPPWPAQGASAGRWRRSASQLPETSAALLAGLLLGERTALPARNRRGLPPRRRLPRPRRVRLQRRARSRPPCSRRSALLGVPRRRDGRRRRRRAHRLRAGRRRATLRAARHRDGPSRCSLSVLLERESQVMNALALVGTASARLASGRSVGSRLSALLRGHGRHHLPWPSRSPSFSQQLGLPHLARGSHRRQPGRAARRDARDAGPLQPALADRRRRQSPRRPAGGAGHDARHARPARPARERDRRQPLSSTRSGCSW